ncbi:TPA: hypothetical protein ACITUP_003329, partial [Salmonella enterica subsp. enterica serovar Virchow]
IFKTGTPFAISGYPYLDEGENGVTPVCAYDGDIVTTELALPGVSSKSGAKPNVITGLIAIA